TPSASSADRVRWMRSRLAGLRSPTPAIRSSWETSGSQNPSTSSKTTGLPCSPSCDQVATSASSSSVPSPPGRATNASDRSYMSCLRSGIDATSCSSVRRVAPLAGEQARWDPPDDPAAVGEGGIGQLTHEAHAATAVDEIDAPAGDQGPEGTGSIPVA